jgi:hypothetical protein
MADSKAQNCSRGQQSFCCAQGMVLHDENSERTSASERYANCVGCCCLVWHAPGVLTIYLQQFLHGVLDGRDDAPQCLQKDENQHVEWWDAHTSRSVVAVVRGTAPLERHGKFLDIIARCVQVYTIVHRYTYDAQI